MDTKELHDLVESGYTQRKIADHLGVSQTTVRYWLKKEGLRTKKEKSNRRQSLHCKFCYQTNVQEFYRTKSGYYRNRCKKCHNRITVERIRLYKQQAVEYKGGKCEICGYSKCLGSLDFHHQDPSQKDPKWKCMRNWDVKKIKHELDKCKLVCKNCHGEIHYSA